MGFFGIGLCKEKNLVYKDHERTRKFKTYIQLLRVHSEGRLIVKDKSRK